MGEAIKWKSLSEQEYPTTLGYILGGRARLEAGKEQGSSIYEIKNIGGRDWSGRSYHYELEVPDIRNPKNTRFIEMKIWDADPVNGNIELNAQTPRTQVEILVAEGWLPLTENPSEIDGVVQEIHRLLDERNREAPNARVSK